MTFAHHEIYNGACRCYLRSHTQFPQVVLDPPCFQDTSYRHTSLQRLIMRSLHFLFAVTAGTAFFHAALGTKDHSVGYVDPDPFSTLDLSVRHALGNHAGLLRREDIITKPPAVTCPEEVGAQPLACSADICGGEDPKKPGQCVREKCKCSNEPSLFQMVITD